VGIEASGCAHNSTTSTRQWGAGDLHGMIQPTVWLVVRMTANSNRQWYAVRRSACSNRWEDWMSGRSKPGSRIVGSHTRWELTTWADFQLCLHWLLMSSGILVVSPATAASWMSVIAMVGWGYQAGLANCHVWQFSPPAWQWPPSFVGLVVQCWRAQEAMGEV